MELYFKNCQGEERLIAECDTVKDVGREIQKFLDSHNYKSYYSRIWGNDEGVTIDVGSYTEFFLVKGISHNEYIKSLESSCSDGE